MSRFTDFLVDVAVLAAVIGLAMSLPDPEFPRSALVAISLLACILIGSVFFKRILEALGYAVEAFFERLPFRKKDPEKLRKKATELEKKSQTSTGGITGPVDRI